MLAFAAPQAAGLSLQTVQGVEHRVTQNQGAGLGYLLPLDRGLCLAFALGLEWVAEEGLVTGIMGVVFFVVNAVFALILLILVLISSVYAIVSKNPDTRYQPMRDDRGSFIKSQTQLTTELDALGATARGETKSFEDSSSLSGFYPNRADSPAQSLQRQQPHSPLESSMPLFPADSSAPVVHGNAAQDTSIKVLENG
ncbi:conserved hypothetical protein [Histoplasma mississippiense (nom. inval.)]|uniref:conserved hypothetical protein n=1 Tax=Ajellomyces capsulatus (strain NAm1 / WU24) TaxID=2059318 RepID=UPI000157CCEE|nr:conserved hypothetical protein [Histoplasma mississippiense (nom. inval.)]EDN10590.1 conserved hypothetical protein [Histoplasma mississippiense (nom. inval.)]